MKHVTMAALRRVRRSTLGLMGGFLAVLALWIVIRPAPAEITQECNADTCVVTVRNSKKAKAEPTPTPVPTATPVPRPTATPTPTPSPKPPKASPSTTPPASAAPTPPAGNDVGGLFAPGPQVTPVPTATPVPVLRPLPRSDPGR